MKKITILFLFGVIANSWNMENPKALLPVPKSTSARPLPTPPKKSIGQLIEEDKARKKEVYYDAAHLKSLDQKKIQKHAPMLIIIDQLQGETDKNDNIPMTFELSYGIKRKLYPILTTASVLKNLLIRMNKHTPHLSEINKDIQEFTPPITAQDWRIYDVPESQFVLLVPNNFIQIYGTNSGIKPLPEITKLLNTSTNDHLIQWLDKNKKIIPFSKAHLERIFISKTDQGATPIWDFVVAGHGNDNPPIIANLSPQSINEMFNFFDTKIKTGMVLIISCLAGGSNRKLLETTQAGIQINHSFILILSSVANEIINTFYPIDYPYLNLFFNNAAQIQDKGIGFDTLWEDLAKAKIKSTKKSVHGFQNIPQVWFPGGLGFQSANISDLVFPIGNVLLKTHQENNEPILIMGDALVLVYPTVIDVPLFVYPISLSHKLLRKNWQHIPHIFELNFTHHNKKNFEKITGEVTVPQLIATTGLSDQDASPRLLDSLYPQFISLNTTHSGHLFTEIIVESTLVDEKLKLKGFGAGVIQFIRDAFFDINPSSAPKIYFIDKLTGFNDISLLLAGSRILRNDPNKHYLEHYLQNFVGHNITLENVMILVNNNNIQFTLYFAIFDTYWMYTSTQAQEDAKTLNWWNFKMMGNVRSTYDKDYQKYKNQLVTKPETINQKSISAVLEEKHRQILLKQAAELKQGKQPTKPRLLPALPTMTTQKTPRPLPTPPIKKARPLPTPPTQK
ncbi:MAG: hypothetical protein AMXMBFR12_05070 [Candidatus Babeliales bacterium]